MNLTFITGGAGTGKSYLLNEKLSKETRPYIVCAPTGIAAINVGGCTVHNAFKVDINGHIRNSIYSSPLKKCEVVYIDEISMLSADLIKVMKEAFAMLHIEPEVIAFGDLAQLQPVKADYFFRAQAPQHVERLTKNYRQAGDLIYAEILNRIREGTIKREDIQWINENANCEDEDITILAFSNQTVDYLNAKALDKLTGSPTTSMGVLKGTMKETEVRAPVALNFKVGAQVIMLNNDRDERWQNGTRAVIKTLNKDTVEIQVKDVYYTVGKYVWLKEEPTALTEEKRDYYMDQLATNALADPLKIKRILQTGIDYIVVGSYQQFPFKLGYASTVHKAQGQTLDKAHIVPDGFGSMHGLAYVALSRLTNIKGLSLERNLNIMDFKFDKIVKQYV
jgi:ATP-dependent DNA helicase PIF1